MRDDGLTRDASGKRTDKTGARDLTFSQWHRKYLSNRAYTTDIDFYEYRVDQGGQFVPKAFLEVKRVHVRQPKYLCSANSRAIFNLARQAGLRFFIILYAVTDPETLECTFWVWEVKQMEDFDRYSEERFTQFFRPYTNQQLVGLLENL